MLATLARVAALRRTCLFSGRGGGRGLWTGRPQSARQCTSIEECALTDGTMI
ncbi:succinyl-CoA:glutarate-CoA transferase [Homo sapiens]|uniref:Succinyl-CoA:glutarate-CoA transferase n=1 Tax=Homo sapiens TaxID=9606 RepID=H7C0H3_HUMAN|nr:succinyl-CoA:glutarate-CoA transferase [Homo sapiens]KAI4013555.1 succinyl-CoA:glutarate-CoA transferase [Homo sapiens]